MNYTEALAYLDGYVNFERTTPDGPRAIFGLARLRELAARLGNPQEKFPALHVAGTKGKGSVCAFAAAMLQAAGLRVGLYISPHLIHVRERIQIDGTPITKERFAQLLTRCHPVLEKMRVRPAVERRLTYFEVMTHLAFLHFAEAPVDVAVVEVGLGGRLDATNIVEPVACGIASLGLEHTRILGSTLPQIAREKAGIFKHGAKGVSAPQPQDAAEVLVEMAGKVDLPLEFLGRDLQVVTRPAAKDAARPALLPRDEVEVRSTVEDWRASATIGLPGKFQAENWALAARLAHLTHLKIRSRPLPEEALRRGAAEVRWPGRLEEMPHGPGEPNYIIDGAHTPNSVSTIVEEMRRMLPASDPRIILFACAKDKDSEGMLRTLAPYASEIVFTFSGNPRGRAPEELAGLWRQMANRVPVVQPDLDKALAAAKALAAGKPNGLVLALGSLYLVGALKERQGLGEDAARPQPE
jgi:dihydrofolate synthase/folylpolyglutamate synthase